MSKFIELSDYDASIHREILDALTREDDAVVEICEDRAVAESAATFPDVTTVTKYSRQPVTNATSLS